MIICYYPTAIPCLFNPLNVSVFTKLLYKYHFHRALPCIRQLDLVAGRHKDMTCFAPDMA